MDELESLLDQIMSLRPKDEDKDELRDEEIAAINAYHSRKGPKPFQGHPRRQIATQANFTGKCYTVTRQDTLPGTVRVPEGKPTIRYSQYRMIPQC